MYMEKRHKHQDTDYLIKESKILGHKIHIIWMIGCKCSICGRIKRKKYLWFDKEKEYIGKLPMIAIMHEDKGE